MSQQFKLGKLAAVRPFGLNDLAVYANGKLPSPPTSVDYYSGLSLPIDGNDRLGDCVMAATAHLIAAWDHEVTETIHVPDETEVVAEYFVLTGGADAGLNESSVLQTWHTSGLFGASIAGYAPVNVKDVTAIQQAIAFYGGAMFGIQCPASSQEQFAAGQPWTYDPSSPIEGGHAIAPLGFDENYVYCATWGGIAPVTYPFLAALLDECWAIIPQAFIDAGKGPAIDLATLQSDLNLLN
jgi:hypothetical protein